MLWRRGLAEAAYYSILLCVISPAKKNLCRIIPVLPVLRALVFGELKGSLAWDESSRLAHALPSRGSTARSFVGSSRECRHRIQRLKTSLLMAVLA